MNKAQLQSICKVFDIKDPIDTIYDRTVGSIDVYQVGDVKFYLASSYLTVRNIPMEVATTIYNKYKDTNYKIRVAGGNSDFDPNDYDNFGFLPLYHIDTYEGAIIFLSELKDYYARKNSLDETFVKNYDELLAKVTEDILKKSYPHIGYQRWIQSLDSFKDRFDLVNRRDLKNRSVTKLKLACHEFELAVNPYENPDIYFDKPVNYLKRMRVCALPYDISTRRGKTDNCLQVTISELPDSGNYTRLLRDNDGFHYMLHYLLDNNEYLDVIHGFGKQSSGNYGEFVVIERYSENIFNTITKYDFDITDKVIKYTVDGVTKTYSKNDYVAMKTLTEKITEEVVYATSLASRITIDNIEKNSSSRTRHKN